MLWVSRMLLVSLVSSVVIYSEVCAAHREYPRESQFNLKRLWAKPSASLKRVVGGYSPETLDWSFIVELIFTGRSPPWKVCTGCVIGKNWVLTAAHCVYSIRYRPSKLEIGLYVTPNNSSRTLVNVKNIIIHPNYKYRNAINIYRYDIALLNTLDPMPVISTKVSLPNGFLRSQSSNAALKQCKTGGYGSEKRFKSAADFFTQKYDVMNKLEMANIPIPSQQKCKESFARDRFFHKNAISVQTICGGYLGQDAKSTPCIGDSGAPLICMGPRGTRTLQGIVISGNPLCLPGKQYTLFTSVVYFKNWITSITEDSESTTVKA